MQQNIYVEGDRERYIRLSVYRRSIDEDNEKKVDFNIVKNFNVLLSSDKR